MLSSLFLTENSRTGSWKVLSLAKDVVIIVLEISKDEGAEVGGWKQYSTWVVWNSVGLTQWNLESLFIIFETGSWASPVNDQRLPHSSDLKQSRDSALSFQIQWKAGDLYILSSSASLHARSLSISLMIPYLG